jgi:metal-responsive CopG/Arc/MetJ family transcriptional regulator
MTKPKRFSIGIDKDLYDWLEAQIEKGIFYSRRHGIEVALQKLKGEVA